MGYDLHITRADLWEDTAGAEIPVAEWIDLVDDDPELESDPEDGGYATTWNPTAGTTPGWFDWFAGSIYTTNPDRDTLAKLLEMAARLKAKVQGDDGEVYETVDDWQAR